MKRIKFTAKDYLKTTFSDKTSKFLAKPDFLHIRSLFRAKYGVWPLPDGAEWKWFLNLFRYDILEVDRSGSRVTVIDPTRQVKLNFNRQ